MKIAILINSLSGGGAERFVSHLVPFLEKNCIDVHLVLLNDKMNYHLTTRNKVFILNKYKFKSGLINFLMIPYLAYRYYIFLKKNDINCCISFLTRSNYISLIVKMIDHSRYIILSERSFPSLQYGYGSLKAKLNLYLIKKTYSKADKIITNSKGNAQDLITKFKIPKDKVKTCYNPVDLELIEKLEPIENVYNKNYYNLICVGRLDDGKNHKMLINSFKRLSNKNVRLYIFGDGPLYKKLQYQINMLNLNSSIFLMPFETNIYQYMKGADLFVFSSIHEGFPNVLLEAMSCGLPIITTNCPSGPNELLECELDYNSKKSITTKYGILVPNNDVLSMSLAIDYLIKDQEYHLSCKINVKKRAQDFTVIKILSEYLVEIKRNKSQK